MSKSMEVKIINEGKDGETRCFKLVDSEGIEYVIDNCHLKETCGVFTGYSGSCNGGSAHLNIFTDGRVELLLNQ